MSLLMIMVSLTFSNCFCCVDTEESVLSSSDTLCFADCKRLFNSSASATQTETRGHFVDFFSGTCMQALTETHTYLTSVVRPVVCIVMPFVALTSLTLVCQWSGCEPREKTVKQSQLISHQVTY